MAIEVFNRHENKYLLDDNGFRKFSERLIDYMELDETIPIWLSRLLSEHRMYRTSFSKYGHEYMEMLTKQRQMERRAHICLDHDSHSFHYCRDHIADRK